MESTSHPADKFIPDQLQDCHLIRVCRPDCQIHKKCNRPGKVPYNSTTASPSLAEVCDWISNGGNYGVVADPDDGIIIWDSDSKEFSDLLTKHLPDTFTVESGGSGYGEHLYYEVEGTIDRQSDWSSPEGSIRVRNWHAVGPGSSHVSGGKYVVTEDEPIATVNAEAIVAVVDELDNRDDVQRGGGGGSGSSTAPPPSAHSVDGLEFIRRDDRRREIAEILKTDSDHTRRVWMTGWLYAAAGLSADEIVDLIVSEARWPKLDREEVNRQVRSVLESSRSSRGTHYTEFGTADMDGNTSERRKTDTEESQSSVNQEVMFMSESDSNDVDYIDKEEVVMQEADADGDRFKKVTVVERRENGDTSRFLALKQGTVSEMSLANSDETALVENVQESNPLKTRPENIDELIDALDELKSKINGDE
jgi:hypothetical protein